MTCNILPLCFRRGDSTGTVAMVIQIMIQFPWQWWGTRTILMPSVLRDVCTARHLWSFLVTFGHIWSVVVISDHHWSLLVTSGIHWLPVFIFGHFWLTLIASGVTGLLLVSYGHHWLRLVTSGHFPISTVDPSSWSSGHHTQLLHVTGGAPGGEACGRYARF